MILLPHCETNITTACQCKCVACTQMVGTLKPSFVEPESVERDLHIFREVAHVEKYAILGGEPTLHKRLVDILHIVRASGIADEIEVWTNGMSLRRQPPEFWESFDTLFLSLYPGKVSDEDVLWIRNKCIETGRNLEVKDARVTSYFSALLTREHGSPQEAAHRYKFCWFKKWTRALNNGYFYRCCTSVFIPRVVMNQPEGTDALSLDGITEQKLQAFLDQAETPLSCFRCTSMRGPTIEWREAGEDTWLTESTIP